MGVYYIGYAGSITADPRLERVKIVVITKASPRELVPHSNNSVDEAV